MTRLGIIADDFTGATDVASLAVRRGAAASVVTDPAATTGDDVLVTALKIRTVPRDSAVREARSSAERHLADGRRLYWKYCSTFDSTADGNIGPVADPLLDLAGARVAMHCPAFPQNGRTVYKGRLFVGDLPLDESPMKDHPLTPMLDASLQRLLAPQVKGPVGLLTREMLLAGGVAEAVAAAIRRGERHLVADAITDADLEALAAQVPGGVLLCGGSAFAAATLPAVKNRSAAFGAPRGPVVLLSGSCSSATRGQVAAWSGPRLDLTPERLAAEGHQGAVAWLVEHLGSIPLLVSATAEPDVLRQSQDRLGAERAAGLVEAAMSALARAARDGGAGAIVVAGGETSGAVTGALDATRLRIGPEIAPGVPVCLSESAGRSLALVLKSGNFGGPTFFADALRTLEELR